MASSSDIGRTHIGARHPAASSQSDVVFVSPESHGADLSARVLSPRRDLSAGAGGPGAVIVADKRHALSDVDGSVEQAAEGHVALLAEAVDDGGRTFAQTRSREGGRGEPAKECGIDVL